MRVGASRCPLRHEDRAYGSQQARKLSNACKREKGTLSAYAQHKLLPSLESLANKGWAIRVPAAAVIPEPRMVITIIGLKAFVAGLESSW